MKNRKTKAKKTATRANDAGAPSSELRGLRISDLIEEMLSQPPFTHSFTKAELNRIIASFRKRRSDNNNKFSTAR